VLILSRRAAGSAGRGIPASDRWGTQPGEGAIEVLALPLRADLAESCVPARVGPRSGLSRKAAEASLREATEGLAVALNRLVGQDVSIERAATLLELDATEVRRLTKLAVENRRPTSSGARQLAPADSDTRVSATQRADEDRGGENHRGSHDEVRVRTRPALTS
jgi:hypothetical protein